jgi:hypothetical protein
MDIVWAPQEIGEGRRFRIIVSADGPVRCECDDIVELIDRTPDDETQKHFYFRVGSPLERGGASEIGIRFLSGTDEETVRLHIVPESDWATPVMRDELPLPRIWKPGITGGQDAPLKTAHTITPADEIGANPDAASDPPDGLDWTYEQLWGYEPPCDIPRWHFLNLDKGCPVHGLDIYKSDPYYPWKFDVRNRPYSVQCPVGGEWYPTNDYAAGDHTSGDYPDDGWGWQRSEDDGSVSCFGFISYWLLRRIRDVYSMVNILASHYKATGDPDTGRRITIMLASLAREHRYLCRFPEHRFRRYERTVEEPQYKGTTDIFHGPQETNQVEHMASSGLDEYCINMPGHYVVCSEAYDLVFDRIDGDTELIGFLSAQMPELADGESIRRWIETYLLRAGVQASLDNATASNLPEPQRGLIYLIRALDTPDTVELTDWLVNGEGQVADMPVNYYYKDGAAYESTGGYNGHHVSALVPIEQGLRALREAHPDWYPASRFAPFSNAASKLDAESGAAERYRDILRWPTELVIAQLSHPFIGDIGDIPNNRQLSPSPVMSMGNIAGVYGAAVERFPDDNVFQAVLDQHKLRQERLREAREQQDAASGFYAAERPPEAEIEASSELWQESRLLDGYGVGILESGERNLDDRRGAWLYYGDHPGHAHEQQLDIGLFAHRRNLIRHMGYPYSWQHMGEWDASWITHHTVRVIGDETPWWRTTVGLFGGGDDAPFQMVEGVGYGVTRDRGEEGVQPLDGHTIRRSVCLVDTPDGGFYMVDLLCVTGGREHWWTFHGPTGKMQIEDGSHYEQQDQGTVAGADVEYGSDPPEGVPESLAVLYDVQRGSGPLTATWNLADTDDLKLRVHQLTPTAGDTILARGRSPHAPADDPPYELDWLLRHQTGEDGLSSVFATVLEADTDPKVRKATPIVVDGLVGVEVELDEVTHTIARCDGARRMDNHDITHQLGNGLQFQGSAVFVERSKSNGAVLRAQLIGEGSVSVDGREVFTGKRDWRGDIESVQANHRSVVVRGQTDALVNAVGEYLFIQRERPGEDGHDTFAYRIEGVEPVGAGMLRFRLNWTPQIGAGCVSEHTEYGFGSDSPMPLAASRGYYRMAHIVSDDGTARARIYSISSGWRSDGADIRFAATDRDGVKIAFPVGTKFTVEEMGPGDAVVILGGGLYSASG